MNKGLRLFIAKAFLCALQSSFSHPVLAVAQFMYIIRRRINLPSEKAMFLFVNKVLPTTRYSCGC